VEPGFVDGTHPDEMDKKFNLKFNFKVTTTFACNPPEPNTGIFISAGDNKVELFRGRRQEFDLDGTGPITIIDRNPTTTSRLYVYYGCKLNISFSTPKRITDVSASYLLTEAKVKAQVIEARTLVLKLWDKWYNEFVAYEKDLPDSSARQALAPYLQSQIDILIGPEKTTEEQNLGIFLKNKVLPPFLSGGHVSTVIATERNRLKGQLHDAVVDGEEFAEKYLKKYGLTGEANYEFLIDTINAVQ